MVRLVGSSISRPPGNDRTEFTRRGWPLHLDTATGPARSSRVRQPGVRRRAGEQRPESSAFGRSLGDILKTAALDTVNQVPRRFMDMGGPHLARPAEASIRS